MQQKSKPPATTEERQFEIAIAAPKICHGTEEDMKKAMRYIYILVGLRAQNYPTGIEKDLLHAFIFKNYGGHSPEELKLAWDMAIMHKLDLRPEDVICYENFSIAYFSKIMEAYRSWSREQIKQLPAPEVKPLEFTSKEKLQLNFDYAYLLLSQVNKHPCKV